MIDAAGQLDHERVARLLADAHEEGPAAVLLLVAQLASAASSYGDRHDLDRRMFNTMVRTVD